MDSWHTRSEERIIVSLKVPTTLAELLLEETAATSTSLAGLARSAVSWHRGEGLARHPDRPPAVLPSRPSDTTVQKGVHLDREHIAYLDHVGSRIGLARTATLLLILVQYLGIDPLPPASRSE